MISCRKNHSPRFGMFPDMLGTGEPTAARGESRGQSFLAGNHGSNTPLDGLGPDGDRLAALDEPEAELVELAGRVKWFDVGKGYGFIVPDNGPPDVLLHVTALRRGGFTSALEGARVICEAGKRAKGLQVFRILSMDESTVVHPAMTPARTHTQVVPPAGSRSPSSSGSTASAASAS